MMKIYLLFLYLVAVEATIFYLQRISSPIIDFAVSPALNLGIYTTTVKMGYPPQNFTVLIDTGSDITWLPCKSCINCPQLSGNEVLQQFNPSVSTSDRLVSCPQRWCGCSSDHLCSYKINYEDTSASSGYFLEDWFWLFSNASWARFVFGCSTQQYGRLAQEGPGFDGILGFNQGVLSVVSQLKINAFSYCLKATSNNNGFLLLGEALHPSLVYSPMIPQTSHYGLYLERIIVNDQTLPIDPNIFRPSKTSRGTVVDSGSNYMLLVGEAYDELIVAVNTFVSPYVTMQTVDGRMCYLINTSISETFPTIILNFAQDATLILNPEQYLFQPYPFVDPPFWCIVFVRTKDITILGDFIFQNKLIVYDLVRQRIGWANYDCSISDNELPVNLFVIPRHTNMANRPRIRYKSILYVLLMYLLIRTIL